MFGNSTKKIYAYKLDPQKGQFTLNICADFEVCELRLAAGEHRLIVTGSASYSVDVIFTFIAAGETFEFDPMSATEYLGAAEVADLKQTLYLVGPKRAQSMGGAAAVG